MARLESVPGGVLLHCHVQDLDWVAGFLAGLGFPMRVRQPPELRDALRRLAERIARAAEPEQAERSVGA
jgi:predicted DNA-binding transcriptional regulator YafY